MPDPVVLKVNFTQPSSPTTALVDTRPVFLTDNGINGAVDVQYDAQTPRPDVPDRVKIHLYGTTVVSIPNGSVQIQGHDGYSSLLKRRILNIVDILPVSAYSDPPSPSPSNPSVKFSLSLPKFLPFATEADSIVPAPFYDYYHIPSSVAVGSTVHASSPGCGQRVDVKVEYVFQASLLRDGKIIGRTPRPQFVDILANSEVQPPTCIRDFSAEYRCHQRRALRKHVFTKIASLSTAVAEPSPFVFRASKDHATTSMPLSFQLAPNQNADSNSTVSRQLTKEACTATVTWRLKTLTFAALNPMAALPTSKEFNRMQSSTGTGIPNPPSTLISTLGRRHKLKLNLDPKTWTTATIPLGMDKDQPSGPDIGPGDSILYAHTSLALAIPRAVCLPPTFFTPHVARRYSLVVQVCFKVGGTGLGSTARLEAPVQIVYEAKGPAYVCDGVDTEEGIERVSGDGDGTLPVYVR